MPNTTPLNNNPEPPPRPLPAGPVAVDGAQRRQRRVGGVRAVAQPRRGQSRGAAGLGGAQEYGFAEQTG